MSDHPHLFGRFNVQTLFKQTKSGDESPAYEKPHIVGG